MLHNWLAGKRRTTHNNFTLGYILAMIAGAINAGGFFLVSQYTSHMTGIISLAADSAALGNYFNALLLIGYIVCFVAGAIFTTSVALCAKRRHLHSQYALPLAAEAIILIAFALCWQDAISQANIIPYFVATICFVMGLQNALITKVSSAIIRTTHITGMTTDLGIELGRILYAKDKTFNRSSAFNNARRHIIIISTFLAGGIMGAISVNLIGAATFAIIGCCFFVLVYPPFRRDFVFFIKIRKRKSA